MAIESASFLAWQVIFVSVSFITATQNTSLQNAHLETKSTCPKDCVYSPCTQPESQERFAVQCCHAALENFTDLSFADKICSLDLSRNNIANISWIIFSNFSAVQNLTLSYNSIKAILENTFEKMESLKYLHLDHNKIEIITEKTFNGLKQLEYLNLAYNSLRKWHGILSRTLPNLHFLNVMGNNDFKLNVNKKLLRDTALKSILGATLTSEGCVSCNFNRTDVPRKELIKLKGCEFIPPYNMPQIDQFQKKYLYFDGSCAEKSCAINLVPMSKVRKTYRNYCWDTARSLRPIEYFQGLVAIAFNVVVIATILSSRFLIKKTSLFLTAQLACGDLFLAVFSITIAKGHGIMTDSGLRQWREHKCPYFRSLLILGQTIEALTSALMTLERYLVIVYCMKPNLRITFRKACFLSAFAWIFGVLSCLVIQHFDNPLIRDNYMCVLIQNLRTAKRILASQVLMLLFVAIYLAVVAMYIHIYVFVKRSAQSAGIQRETSLAKRISVIVLSNMFFYAVPNLFIVIFSAGNINVTLSHRTANFVLRIWLPPMCMITNACLNPLLFAFRNDEFLKSFREVVSRIVSRVCRVKALSLAKRSNQGRLYVVNGSDQGQTSSQLTLNESTELYTTYILPQSKPM